MHPRPDAAETRVGMVIGGRYRLVQLLGSGGSGHVYLAEPTTSIAPIARGQSPPRVALKLLRPEHLGRADLVARFEREAAAASRIDHPNVLRVHQSGTLDEGQPYFVMELLVGLDLADTLARCQRLAPARALRIAAGAAAGLGAAHAAGVVHRDVKPENIFLVHEKDGTERPRLLDFGFSRLPDDPPPPRRSLVVGTPEYMAPEQAQGAPGHPSADIYSLGVVLYEMLAGRPPFSGPYPAIARRHAQEAPAPIPGGISPAIDEVLLQALAKRPEDRFPTMADFKESLLGLLGDRA
ncbi:MAG: serine/threonine-protein kinase [Byssovorax sp.]